MDDSGVLCDRCGSRGHNTAGHMGVERHLWAQSFVDGQIVKVLVTVRYWMGGKRGL